MGAVNRMHSVGTLGLCRERYPKYEHKLWVRCFWKWEWLFQITPRVAATCPDSAVRYVCRDSEKLLF